MNRKGFTLIELLIVIAIMGIIAGVAIPAYVGQQRRAARAEAYTNLETIRLVEEQRFADQGSYIGAGVCAPDQNGNIGAIQNVLPRFQPGSALNYSYCIEANLALNGAVTTNCFRASAYGNTGTRVTGDLWQIDCRNDRNF
jgi:prepilin-type N-terminal cleavage/methylation domain-containing protein